MKDSSAFSWKIIHASLNEKGYAIVPSVLSKEECATLIGYYTKNELYRSTINMQRYRFGKGEYKYFNYPLPELLQNIRESFYIPLSRVANEWMNCLGIETIFPPTHEALIEECHSKGQNETGGYNTLHQDLYGDVYFPFQVVFVLNEAGKDYEGGESVLIEQLPRAQSRAEVVKLQMGDAMIFTTNFRPVNGTRGFYRAKMKHGISPLKSGTRYAMGIIFHDAS